VIDFMVLPAEDLVGNEIVGRNFFTGTVVTFPTLMMSLSLPPPGVTDAFNEEGNFFFSLTGVGFKPFGPQI
jgi:hypothetical protein